MGIGYRIVSVMLFETRVAVDFFGGKIVRAIKG